jgi:hypothetical protein
MTDDVMKPSDLLGSIVGDGKLLRPIDVAAKIAATKEYAGDGSAQINKWRRGDLGFNGGGSSSRRARRVASAAIGRAPDFFEKAYLAWQATLGSAPDDRGVSEPNGVEKASGDAEEWQSSVSAYVLSERGRSTPGPVVVKLLQLSPEARRAVGWSSAPDDIHRARQAIETQERARAEAEAAVSVPGCQPDRAWVEALERNFAEHGAPSPPVLTRLYESRRVDVIDIDAAVAQLRATVEADTVESRPARRSGKAAVAKRRHR